MCNLKPIFFLLYNFSTIIRVDDVFPLLCNSWEAVKMSWHAASRVWVLSLWIWGKSRLISFRTDWMDLLAVQGTLKSLLQHHSSKVSILWSSAFFIVHLSHPYMTTAKTIALTKRTFVGKVMSLLFNTLSKLVINFSSKEQMSFNFMAEVNQFILKEISPEYSLEGLMLKLELQYFGHLMQRADSSEKILMLGKIDGRRRRGWQRMRWLDGITDSMDKFE